MRILALADEPSDRLWGTYGKETLRSADLILSCGDLPASYLGYMTCFSSAPVVYVHGNHDTRYLKDPPAGCICAEGHVVLCNGLRILGLGGSMRYRPDNDCMFTEEEMAQRILRLRRELRKTGGFDILLTHSPIRGFGDQDDLAHRGFACFGELLDKYNPAMMFHGHVHQAYSGSGFQRTREWNTVPVINASGYCELDFPDPYTPAALPSRSGHRLMKKNTRIVECDLNTLHGKRKND